MEKLPRKYCRPGQSPEEPLAPCVPTAVTVDLRADTVIVVSLEGEAWLENGLSDMLTEAMEKISGKSPTEH